MSRDSIPILLTPPPIGKSVGDMADDETVFGWVQSPDQYLGVIARHHGTYRLNGKTYPFQPYDFLLATPGSRCEIVRSGESAESFMTDDSLYQGTRRRQPTIR